MLTTMRSNDVYTGLPHDIFCFTMMQEVMARTLGVKLGIYKQFVGSLHLYDEDREAAQRYLDEAVQATVLMPPMPTGDPWPSLKRLLDAEYRIRHGIELDPSVWDLDSYWADLIRLLQIYAASGDVATIEALQSKMAHRRYTPYIESRKAMSRRATAPQRQLLLPL
jgi:thymidylate synthase